jgi:TonB family protein
MPRLRPGAWMWALLGALTVLLGVFVFVLGAGGQDTRSCGGRRFADAFTGRQRPDELPVMLNPEPPFRYPAALYARRMQGNVTLCIFIDRDGHVRPESTRVEESSGYSSLDSSAVTGSQELHFVPAKLSGEPVAVSILFPVFFRHPEATPLPGDTVLKRR